MNSIFIWERKGGKERECQSMFYLVQIQRYGLNMQGEVLLKTRYVPHGLLHGLTRRGSSRYLYRHNPKIGEVESGCLRNSSFTLEHPSSELILALIFFFIIQKSCENSPLLSGFGGVGNEVVL